MKFKIDCGPKNTPLLERALTEAGFQIGDDAPFVITESMPVTDYLTGIIDETYEPIPVKAILYIEAFGHDVQAHTAHKPYHLKEKLYQLERQLSGRGFIRINKSQLINIRHIKAIHPWFGQRYRIDMNNGTAVDVNRTYYRSFKDYFNI